MRGRVWIRVTILRVCDKGPQAEFKLRESTKDLIRDAKKAVEDTLKDGFGTPNNLVAWERFPVGYGGVSKVP